MAPGQLMVIAACALFGLTGAVSRILIDGGVTEITLTQFRMFFGFVTLFAVLLVFRRDLLRVPRVNIVAVVGFGLSLAMVIYFYFMAIARLPLAVALVLQFSAAAWMAAGESLWRRRRPPMNIPVTLALTLGGVVLMVGFRGADLGKLDGLGVLYGFATTASYIVYLRCGKRVGKAVAAPSSTTYGALVAAAFWSVVQPPWAIDSRVWQPDLLLPLIGIGVVGMALPFALVLAALRRIGPTQVGMLSTFEVVAASAVAFVWIGQSLTPWQLVGCLSVVCGVLVCGYHSRPARPATVRAPG